MLVGMIMKKMCFCKIHSCKQLSCCLMWRSIFIAFFFFCLVEWRMKRSWTEERPLSSTSVMKRKWKVSSAINTSALSSWCTRDELYPISSSTPGEHFTVLKKDFPLMLDVSSREDVLSSVIIVSSSGCFKATKEFTWRRPRGFTEAFAYFTNQHFKGTHKGKHARESVIMWSCLRARSRSCNKFPCMQMWWKGFFWSAPQVFCFLFCFLKEAWLTTMKCELY